MTSPLARLKQFAAGMVPPALAGADQDTCRRAHLIVQFSLAILLSGPAYGALYLSLGMHVSAIGAGLCALLLGFTPRLLRRTGSVGLGAHWVTGVSFVVLGFVTLPTGGLAAPALEWLALIPVTALMLGGRRIGGVWTGISLAAAAGYFVLDLSGHTPPSEAPAAWLPLLRVMVAAGLISLIALLAWLYEANKDRMLAVVLATSGQVAQARDQYRALVESTRTIPWELDPVDQRFTYVGPQAAALLGCPADEWLARDFLSDRLHPDDRDSTLGAHGLAGQQRLHHDLEYRLRRNDGRWVWVRSIVSASSGGAASLRGILLDTTERRELELELLQAQKLESVGRLAAGIAHEINTPVQFVSDSVHFLRQSYGDLLGLLARYQAFRETAAAIPALADPARELGAAEEESDLEYLVANIPGAADRAIAGLARVAAIVRSMRQFAHPDGADKVSADVNQGLAAALIMAKHEYSSVADVESRFDELPLVVCHPSQLNQVFLNLIVNAAHSIADVVAKTQTRGRIEVSSRCAGDSIVIAIADTGSGIPAAIQERIFDPFFTTKAVGKGTGQGLAIARNIVVDNHGGSLTFDTDPHRGTTFTISLPVAGATATTAPRAGAAPPI
jgi:PAS domain S-box-containing protein